MLQHSATLPESAIEASDASRLLDGLKRQIDLYAVSKESMIDDRNALMAEKKRHERTLDRVPVAQSLLQDLYDKSSGALIRSCEDAMTDAVQGVIGDKSEIGIDAEISNNQIKVSVGTVIHLQNDERVLRDIVSNEGGGLTNVVSTSLRAISLVRSGQRRFIVLDESNCYLNPSQIPPYMAVIRDLAYRAGFQIIMLTHHGIDQFADDRDVNIITLRPTDDGATLTSTHPADTTTPGIISSIDLENFGAHAKLHVPLVAGLNIITGPSNVGKSRILSALRAVIVGDGSVGDIRTSPGPDGKMTIEKTAVVRLTFDGGKTIEWTRKKSGSPAESWVLRAPGSDEPVTLDGIVCSGRNGKQWVGRKDVMNMTPIGDMWPALHSQKLPVFALDNPKALSALIAVSKTSIHLQSMITAVSEEKREAMAEIRRIDARLDKLSVLIFKLESDLTPIQRAVEEAIHLQEAIAASVLNLNAANDILDEFSRLQQECSIGERAKQIKLEPVKISNIDDMLDLIEARNLAEIDLWAAQEASFIGSPDAVEIKDFDGALKLIRDHARAQQEVQRAEIAKSLTVDAPELPDIAGMFDILYQYDSLSLDVWVGQNADAIKQNLKIDDRVAHAVTQIEEMTGTIQQVMKDRRLLQFQKRAAKIAESIRLPSLPERDVIQQATTLIGEYQTARAELASVDRKYTEAQSQQKAIQDEINRLKPLLGACPTCGHIGGIDEHIH